METRDLIQDNLLNTEWLGIVENNEDPTFQGRCKIRVYGKFDGRINNNINNDYIIPTEYLPWAIPGFLFNGGAVSGSGSFTVPKLNSIVKVKFENGNIYTPIYYNNIYVSDDVIQEISNSYNNSHVLIYDTAFNIENGSNTRQGEHIKVFFTEEKGLVIDYSTKSGSSIINIKNDNTIYIEHANGKIIHVQKDHISIGKENVSDEPAVLGNKNVDALNSLADQINELSKSIQQFAITQSAITNSIFTLTPLTAALNILNTDQIKIQNKIQTPIKSSIIPKTRSQSISIDGPSKNN